VTWSQSVSYWIAAVWALGSLTVLAAVPAFAIPWRNERLRWLRTTGRWTFGVLLLLLALWLIVPLLLPSHGAPA
jgi:Na+/phosphate symporter